MSVGNAMEMSRKEILKAYKKKTPFQEFSTRFLRNRLAVVGLVIFFVVLLGAVFADQIVSYENSALKMNISERLQGISAAHWFGTDEKGRDIFARIIHGARTSLLIGFTATAFSLIVGAILGSVSGFYGGFLGEIIMRIMDVMLCLPSTLLAMAIVAAWGSSTFNMILAIGISHVPKMARTVRSAVLTVRDMEYVEAARAIGARNPVIISRHVLLNCLGPITVQVTLAFAGAILAISSLSFLGLGIKPPTPEWGNMLADGRANMRSHANLVLAPGMAIFLTIFSLNCLGDGLRDALDPKLKR